LLNIHVFSPSLQRTNNARNTIGIIANYSANVCDLLPCLSVKNHMFLRQRLENSLNYRFLKLVHDVASYSILEI